METESNKKELKHLGFVRMAAIHALVCVSNLYDYAKHNLRPLRSALGNVESAVTTIVGPIFDKFKGVPDDFLVFFDKKVDENSHKFDEHAPPAAKHAVGQAQTLIEKASQKTRKFVNEAQTWGPRATLNYVAGEYKQVVMVTSVKVWEKLNHCKVFHRVADVTVPKAAHLSEKYNHVVVDMDKKGYTVFHYLPLVPADEIAKAFNVKHRRNKLQLNSRQASNRIKICCTNGPLWS